MSTQTVLSNERHLAARRALEGIVAAGISGAITADATDGAQSAHNRSHNRKRARQLGTKPKHRGARITDGSHLSATCSQAPSTLADVEHSNRDFVD
jgi:hypothetical protein